MSIIRRQSNVLFGTFLIGPATGSMDACAGIPGKDTRKRMLRGSIVGAFPSPTDPIGTSKLTVSNILPESEVRLVVNINKEIDGGWESIVGTDTIVFSYDVFQTPYTAYLVVLKPGYHPMRIPFQLGKLEQAYTVYQTVDPSYM